MAQKLTVVVTGSTGKQGGAVARGLLERGHKVRAVTRDPNSSQAKLLANAGATLVTASLEDTAAIEKALEGATSLFAMTMPSGGTDADAVQLASHAGATVIATASGDDEAYLNSIGASRVLDYREAQFEEILREKVDVVFDLVGGDAQKRSFLVLKEGGHLVSAVQPVSQEEAAMHHVSGVMMRLAPSGDVLGRIGRLLEEGTIRPDVATVYALQDAAQAWKDIAEKLPRVHGMSPSEPGAPRRKKHGKIVLRVA